MASVRSISASKPSEQLSTQRFTRPSTSLISSPQKKLSINKSNQIAIPTSSSRQKLARMSLKKSLQNSSTSPAILDEHLNIATNQIAAIQIQDTPSDRSRSRNSISHFNFLRNESSLNNNQYTLESFDTIRTVGTGKKELTKKRTIK